MRRVGILLMYRCYGSTSCTLVVWVLGVAGFSCFWTFGFVVAIGFYGWVLVCVYWILDLLAFLFGVGLIW